MNDDKVSWIDAEELAKAVLGLDSNADSGTVEAALLEKFEVSFDDFHKIVEALVWFTPLARALLSGDVFHGFVHDGAFLIKIKAKK